MNNLNSIVIKKGRIIYADGITFKILTEDDEFYFAKPVGKMKLKGIKPKIGDIVDISIPQNGNQNEINSIIKIYERFNYLYRPIISNIDFAFVVTSLKEPNFDFYLLLKFLTMLKNYNVRAIILFSKFDLLSKNEIKNISKYFNYLKEIEQDYIILDFNKPDSTNQVKEFIDKKSFGVIFGQTGAGKSTFLNNLSSNLDIKTMQISKRLNRGKHTTRNYSAYNVFEQVYIVDTPGFSSFDLEDFSKEQVADNFTNFIHLKQFCKYNDCIHFNEPDCEVKKEYKDSKDSIKNEVYEIYLKLINFDN